MIRPAKFADIMELQRLLASCHDDTIYSSLPMDVSAARDVFKSLVGGQGKSRDGGSCLFVHVREGVIRGFVGGLIDRLYHVGEDLWTTDVFLHVAKGEKASVMHRLVGEYLDWAESNPRVFEVRLSTSYAAPTGRKMAGYIQRQGFEECARVFSRPNPNFAAKHEMGRAA